MSWPTTADGLWYLFDGQVRIPIDSSTGVAQIILRPQGGMGVGIPAIADGAPGPAPTLQTAISFTELAHDDPTLAGASWMLMSPGPPPVYALTLALHKGAPGADGTVAIGLAGIGGTAAAGKLIKVNTGATGFDFAYEKVGDRYLPATINNTASGNATSTLATVPIAARNFDWRPEVSGFCVVTKTGGGSAVVDLVARLNTEASGNIVGSCPGLSVTSAERLVLTSAPAAGSADTFDKVLAGNAATLYLRTEQQSGADSYTTSSSTTRFKVRVCPVP